MPDLTNASGSTFQISGAASLSLPALTAATATNFEVSGGASLDLAGLDAYTQPNNCCYTAYLEATGAGSVLSLPDLASIANTGSGGTVVEALLGGDVEVPLVTQVTGNVELESNSSASTLDLADLATFTGGTLAYSGGTLTHGGGTQPLPDLTNANGSTFQISGGVSLSLPTLSAATATNFEVSGGASLDLVGLDAYTQPNNCCYTAYLEATGAGSVLSLPDLASIANTGSGGTVVEALLGGDVEVPLVTQVTGNVALESEGTGSVLNLSALQSLSGSGGTASLTITQGGAVSDPDLTKLASVKITTDSTGTLTLPANQTFSFTGGTNTVQMGTFLVQGSLGVQNGATLNIEGDLTFNGLGSLSMSSSSTLEVSGNLLGNTTNAAGFSALGTIVLDSGNGTSNPPQLLEAMSQDAGNVSAGFAQNFAYNTLTLTANTYVELVDDTANSPGGTPEAVYVNTLNVPAGATLNLNGLHLYASTENIKGTITGGVVSPTTVEWISSSSGNWNTASDWSTGVVPSSNQEVIIDVSGASPTITISSGSMSVYSITADDPLSITGGSLTVASDSTISGGLAMTGGSLVANGSGATLTVSGTTIVSGANLYAEGGATLTLQDLTSYSNPSGGTTYFQATGAGSTLSLPALASLGTVNNYLYVQALQGGQTDLLSLAAITSTSPYVQVESNGSGSTIKLSALTSFAGSSGYARLTVTASGTVLDGDLTSLGGVDVTLDGTGILATSQWTSLASGGALTITGGAYTLGLTDFDGSSAYVARGTA